MPEGKDDLRSSESSCGNDPTCVGANLPDDRLNELFDAQAIAALTNHASPSRSLLYRIRVLESEGPCATSLDDDGFGPRFRAQRAAWNAYLDAAFACGLFEGESGKDLCSRLRGEGDENFRSAMTECMATWFLSARLKLQVSPRPRGRGTHTLELLITTPEGELAVEVKAPHREERNTQWSGDDTDMLERCLTEANRQFEKGHRNLLFLAPSLRLSVYSCRQQLIKAFLGPHKFSVKLQAETFEPVGDCELKFFPEGRFLQTRLPSGKPIKPDGSPPFTRVSGVLCVEEDHRGGCLDVGPERVEHTALFLHNPCAEMPIGPEIFRGCVQLDYETDTWTDGRGLFP